MKSFTEFHVFFPYKKSLTKEISTQLIHTYSRMWKVGRPYPISSLLYIRANYIYFLHKTQTG